jgi:hypothetical protein
MQSAAVQCMILALRAPRPGSLFSAPTRHPHETSPCTDPIGYRQAWQHQVARSEVARSSGGDRGTSHDCHLVLDALVAIGSPPIGPLGHPGGLVFLLAVAFTRSSSKRSLNLNLGGASLEQSKNVVPKKWNRYRAWLVGSNIVGAVNPARASSPGRNGHASPIGLWPGQDTGSWCLRGQNYDPPCSQVCPMAWRRLRFVALLLSAPQRSSGRSVIPGGLFIATVNFEGSRSLRCPSRFIYHPKRTGCCHSIALMPEYRAAGTNLALSRERIHAAQTAGLILLIIWAITSEQLTKPRFDRTFREGDSR